MNTDKFAVGQIVLIARCDDAPYMVGQECVITKQRRWVQSSNQGAPALQYEVSAPMYSPTQRWDAPEICLRAKDGIVATAEPDNCSITTSGAES